MIRDTVLVQVEQGFCQLIDGSRRGLASQSCLSDLIDMAGVGSFRCCPFALNANRVIVLCGFRISCRDGSAPRRIVGSRRVTVVCFIVTRHASYVDPGHRPLPLLSWWFFQCGMLVRENDQAGHSKQLSSVTHNSNLARAPGCRYHL